MFEDQVVNVRSTPNSKLRNPNKNSVHKIENLVTYQNKTPLFPEINKTITQHLTSENGSHLKSEENDAYKLNQRSLLVRKPGGTNI